MIEAELDSIKMKLKESDFDLQDSEKKLLKIEKKLILLENKFTNMEDTSSEESNNTSSEESNNTISIDVIIGDLKKLDSDISELNNINTNIPIEKLIDNYILFKDKINSIRTNNEKFKMTIQYL